MSCSRTQRSDAGEARTFGLELVFHVGCFVLAGGRKG